nr:immunoglobulin light chain junction region [Macaca mulatta]MOX71510.1 immunoglobulin light chain junction region [Macaca mulatta]MOX74693.1 immunoglobulin light chain junction region [Macaca mulatta]
DYYCQVWDRSSHIPVF